MFNRSFVLLLLLCSPFALADTLQSNRFTSQGNFIQQRALGPIKLQTGLPEPASRLTTSSELQLSLLHSNVFMGGRANSERLILDGESSQLNLRYRQRLNACWQLNIAGVALAHSNGWFDQPLDDWHQFFGLPDAQRGNWPENQLEYLYDNGDVEQALNTSNRGLGDAQIQVQRNWSCSPNAAVTRFGIKIPFGDSAQFNGSGGVDAFIDLQTPWLRSSRFPRIQWASSLGLLGIGKNHLVAEAHPLVGFGAAGVNFALTARSQLLAQLDWHTPMFRSELRELNELSVQLSLGLRYQTGNNGAWEFSFSEDAAVDTVPDIAVRLAWLFRFDHSP